MSDTFIKSGNPQIDALFPRVKAFLQKDVTDYDMFGARVRGYRTPDAPSVWIRDNPDMMRAYKYWERDMKSLVDHFADTQSAKGWVFDYFTMTPEKTPCEKENWAKYVRVPTEADVEFRFVKAGYLAWQATGDDRWLRKLLPHMEKALHYVLTDPWRWDPKTKLVKRGLTIDTWDFDYTAGCHPWLNFQITDHTFWGIMHGDSSGYYEAFLNMSKLYGWLRDYRRSQFWRRFAEGYRKRANKVSFNGRFYTHHVPLVPRKIEGVDESEQLSLSNPMDINRGLPTHDMAVSIIQEYQRRRATTNAFAEWFSIDPPFPAGIFGDEKLIAGAYCNGGIMPLVGGELARAAFEHGFEEFGVETLLRYEELSRNNESYLWYFPDGRHATVETSTSPDASPTDGWGSSAMVYALMEGLAGVEDERKLYQSVRLSPRWVAAGLKDAAVCCVYGASGASMEYRFSNDASRKLIELELRGSAQVDLHLLLPHGTVAGEIRMNGKQVKFHNTTVKKSRYVDAVFPLGQKSSVLIKYKDK